MHPILAWDKLDSTEFRPVITIFAFMWTVFREFFRFCAREKKWWLLPLLVLVIILAMILVFSGSSGVVWSLYPTSR